MTLMEMGVSCAEKTETDTEQDILRHFGGNWGVGEWVGRHF
jgi:hypothetical protein